MGICQPAIVLFASLVCFTLIMVNWTKATIIAACLVCPRGEQADGPWELC